MSKKKKSKKKKKVNKKDTKSPKSSKKKSAKKSGYKRGSLSQAMWDLFDKVGVDDVTYEECLKRAKEVKKDTKFDKYHFSWYKNKYRQMED